MNIYDPIDEYSEKPEILIDESERRYVFIFTRQDISAEQQMVQSSHVALKLGYLAAKREIDIDPNKTYFTLVGVRNLKGLEGAMAILSQFHYPFETFVEPDIGYEPTSIATYPIRAGQRGPLNAFNWLKVK